VSGPYDLGSNRVTAPLRDKALSVEVGMSPAEDPATDEGHVLEYWIGKDREGGAAVNARVALMCGETEVAAWDHPDVRAGEIPVRQTLAPEQAAAIEDYGDLRVKVDYSRGTA